MRRLPPFVVAAALILGLTAGAAYAQRSAPRPTPRAFVSIDKNLTFPTPAGTTYCPLPRDWIGSDHGTTIFLAPRPEIRCGGAGYPSSSRGVSASAPRISIYYGYDVLDDDEKPPPAPCREIGRVTLLGGSRAMCADQNASAVQIRVEAPYQAEGASADLKAEAIITLVTAPDRLNGDLVVFRSMIEAVGICNRTNVRGSPSYANTRPACAKDARFF